MCPDAVPWQPQLPTSGRSSLLSAVNSIVTGRASPHISRPNPTGQATIQQARARERSAARPQTTLAPQVEEKTPGK